MKLLAIETATACQSVALLEGERVLARSDEDAKGHHARWLVPAVDRVLASCGLSLHELDALAVSSGPGSFTGLRVGLATMLGFRTITGRPLMMVPSLEALAWNVRGTALPVCAMFKARTEELYWAQFQWETPDRLRRVTDDRVGSLAEAALAITGPTLVLGEGWLAYREELRRLLGTRAGDAREAPLDAMSASAVSVGLAAWGYLAQGEVAGPVVSPRYVQRAEAELMWERRPPSSGSSTAARGG